MGYVTDDFHSDGDLKISLDLFETANNVNTNFYSGFKESYEKMSTLLKEFKNNKDFAGSSAEGFVELFDIVVQCHEDFVNEYEPFFKAFEDFKEELLKIKKESVFTNIKE